MDKNGEDTKYLVVYLQTNFSINLLHTRSIHHLGSSLTRCMDDVGKELHHQRQCHDGQEGGKKGQSVQEHSRGISISRYSSPI